MIIKLDSIIQ